MLYDSLHIRHRQPRYQTISCVRPEALRPILSEWFALFVAFIEHVKNK